jgi:asparagine synthase (glutamine-hydrolysing)
VSGLAGIFRFDGGLVEPAALDAMVAALPHRGPDGVGRRVDGPVGMARLLQRTSGAAAGDADPAVHPPSGTWLTLDGRIDNRGEVRAALGPDRDRLRTGSDQELALHAYLRWGRAAFARLVGDFAVVVWDPPAGELLAARDPMGKRPLHYRRDRRSGTDVLRWASEVSGVLADPAIPRRPNPGMVAEQLVGVVTSTTETLFQGVFRVPPAHVLVARTDGRLTVERTWSWDRSTARPRGAGRGHEAEWVDRFREVFTTAVRDRLVGDDPIAAELSGGVDSSSVVAVAAAELAAAGRPAPALFSITFPGTPADERPYSRAVAERVGTVAHELEHHPLGPAHYDAEQARTLLPAGPPNLAMHRAHLLLTAQLGSTAVLTGQGGDEWLTGSAYALADDLRRLRLRGLRSRARGDRAEWPARSPLHQIVRDGVLPLVGGRHRRALPLDVLTPSFRAEVGLEDRLALPPLRGPVRATEAIAAILDHGTPVHIAEQAERLATSLGVELRTPFDDRRVVELALALPEELRRRDGLTRWVVREALAGLLPPAVLARRDKANLVHVVVDELEAQGGRALFDRSALAEAGWLDLDLLRAAYPEILANRRAGRGHRLTWAAWNAVRVDSWLRSV